MTIMETKNNNNNDSYIAVNIVKKKCVVYIIDKDLLFYNKENKI
ncbi:MAG TPA: hypothetical protein VLA74_02970 [Nitrososphaeraceae archaeon]|nr:hypothetical protein [Nitrososphaeraceae archaeon]